VSGPVILNYIELNGLLVMDVNGKGFERRRSRPLLWYYPNIRWRDWGTPPQIHIEYLPNVTLQCSYYNNLLEFRSVLWKET